MNRSPKKSFFNATKVESFAPEDSLKNWCSEYLHLDPQKTILMSELYEKYLETTISKGQLPYPRKTFVTKLKTYFTDQINARKIQFVHRQGSRVLGLTLKSTIKPEKEFETSFLVK